MINKVTLIKLWLTINQNCENLINGILAIPLLNLPCIKLIINYFMYSLHQQHTSVKVY